VSQTGTPTVTEQASLLLLAVICRSPCFPHVLPQTRWENYYIQGLQWLTQPQDNPKAAAIDGLYLDELSFDRGTMMRMRKAVDQYRSGCLFDLHSCNKFHCGIPSAPHACSALICKLSKQTSQPATTLTVQALAIMCATASPPGSIVLVFALAL
jgi:hypothetical protein